MLTDLGLLAEGMGLGLLRWLNIEHATMLADGSVVPGDRLSVLADGSGRGIITIIINNRLMWFSNQQVS